MRLTTFNFDYDKLFLKQITILIPKYHSNMVSFLTPILGLYGINVKEFINEFEAKSRFVNFDVTIPVTVKITKIKTFSIVLRTPYVSSIINNLNISYKNLNILTFYKIITLKSLQGNIFLSSYLKTNYTNLRIYLSRIGNLSEDLIIKKSFLKNFNPYILLKSSLKKSLDSTFFINKFFSLTNTYGLFVSFYNYNSNIIDEVKLFSSILNVNFWKIKPKLLSLFSPGIKGHAFYFGASNFANFNQFLKNVKFKNNSTYFNLFYKINNNILYSSFFDNKFRKPFELMSNKNVCTLMLLNILFLKSIKILAFKNLTLLKLLRYKSKN